MSELFEQWFEDECFLYKYYMPAKSAWDKQQAKITALEAERDALREALIAERKKPNGYK